MEILNLLAWEFTSLNILLLIVSFFIVSSFIKNKIIKIIGTTLFGFFTTLQISSLLLVENFINYRFIIHLNSRDILGVLGLYTYNLIEFVFVLLVLTLLFFFSKFLTGKVNLVRKRYFPTLKITKKPKLLFKFGVIILSLFVMSLEDGLLNHSYKLSKSLYVHKNRDFKKVLNELGMVDYVFPNELVSSSTKKNIIIISLESFEKGYLSDKFSHLTPYLRSLKSNEEWSYYEMNQNEGSKWTSGALYTTLTGFPAFFGTEHNSIFQTSYKSNITSISNVLKKANYKMTYLTSNAVYSGTKDILNTFQINDIIDIKVAQNSKHDKDLFESAKRKISSLSKTEKPFLLYMSTLSTHNPNGIYDKRMEKYLPIRDSKIEFMASAVDYMVRDFINYLEELNMLSNTVLYILPDHLKHGSGEMFEGTGKRGLWLLTNAFEGKGLPTIHQKDTLVQIDLPKVILEGAEIKHNAKFFTDYIVGDKNQFIKDNITKITELNISGLSRIKKTATIVPKISNSYEIYKKDTTRFIAHAGGRIDGRTYTNSLEALNLSYEKGFRMFELDILKTSDNKYVAVHDWRKWTKVPTHKEFMNHKIHGKYSPLDMNKINNWFRNHPDAILITDKINEPQKFSNLFIDKKRLMMELFTWEAVLKGIDANIRASMPTQTVLIKTPIDTLKKYNIKDVVLSRLIIPSRIEALIKLKENKIRVYAYHINVKIDKDEEYVVKYEMDYIYGIYADDWDFRKN